MNRRLVLLAGLLVVTATAVGASAFTRLDVARFGGTIEVRETAGTVDVGALPPERVGDGDGGQTMPAEPAVGGGGGGGGGGGAAGTVTAPAGAGSGAGGNASGAGGGNTAGNCVPVDGTGLTLTPGDAGTTVATDADGDLVVDFDVVDAGLGANVAAVYLVGNPDDQPAGEHAFSATNNFEDAADVAVNYTADDPAVVDGEHNVVVDVFAADGSPLTWTSEEVGVGAVTGLAAGDVVCATVTIDTRSLATADDLGGTLNVTASPS